MGKFEYGTQPWHISPYSPEVYKADKQQLATCPTTGETHVYHRAYWMEGKLYYKGKVVMEKENKS